MSAIAALGDAVATGLTTRVVVVCAAVGCVLWMVQEWRRRARRVVRRVPREPRKPIDPATLFSGGVESIATLHLPTGKIVACDPLVNAETLPFDRTVPPGDYPVDVCVSRERVAAVRIVFAAGTPTRWVAEDSYGVDTGLGCFMDATTAALLVERQTALLETQNYYDDVIANQLTGRWLDHHPVADRPENCAIVQSGLGDGLYTTYWGLDASDTPLCLVTDFDVRA